VSARDIAGAPVWAVMAVVGVFISLGSLCLAVRSPDDRPVSPPSRPLLQRPDSGTVRTSDHAPRSTSILFWSRSRHLAGVP
jgi:hypothetical protein